MLSFIIGTTLSDISKVELISQDNITLALFLKSIDMAPLDSASDTTLPTIGSSIETVAEDITVSEELDPDRRTTFSAPAIIIDSPTTEPDSSLLIEREEEISLDPTIVADISATADTRTLDDIADSPTVSPETLLAIDVLEDSTDIPIAVESILIERYDSEDTADCPIILADRSIASLTTEQPALTIDSATMLEAIPTLRWLLAVDINSPIARPEISVTTLTDVDTTD
jgi:hypothetical protein